MTVRRTAQTKTISLFDVSRDVELSLTPSYLSLTAADPRPNLHNRRGKEIEMNASVRTSSNDECRAVPAYLYDEPRSSLAGDLDVTLEQRFAS
jgi:hypothetical protein